ncbi:MAG: DUF4339 domain-containing protein [Verrucomicrobiaceae bacterium]|nr:DUF4339 domain-containing protein [Verrucomicrobiaceae bacterium]
MSLLRIARLPLCFRAVEDVDLRMVHKGENDFGCMIISNATILAINVPSRPVTPAYYIAKGQKTLGPCSLDDLRNFLAYGSISHGDLVMRDGEQQWHPVASLHEIAAEDAPESREQSSSGLLPRRRTVRYRDYERVPLEQREDQVLMWLAAGFVIFPPLLWRAAHAIFSARIFRRRADENGYLTCWPRWVEALTTALIVINGIAWMSLLAVAWSKAGPLVREMMGAFGEGMNSVKSLF